MSNTTLAGGESLVTVTLDNGSDTLIIESIVRKEGFLVPMPLYLNDSDLTDVFDFGGAIKTITLSGTKTGSASEQKDFIDSVEAFIQGHQDIAAGYPLTFTDDLRGTIKVKVMDFESSKVEGQPSKITWVIKLVEASPNA